MKAIRAGRLIDGTGAAVQHGVSVFCEEGRIVGVEPSGDTPSDAEVIDASESTVMPGLIDGHVHLVFSAAANPLGDLGVEDDQRLLLRSVAAARRALAAGVTTVRDLGGRGGVTFRLRDAIKDGLVRGPRVLAAGSPITITGGHCHFLGLEADDEAGVRAAARSQLKAGASCLKIMATGGRMTPGTNVGRAQFSVAELSAAVDEARRGGVPIAAHALGTDGIRAAARAGVDTIEHCSWLGALSGVEFDEATAALMAEKGIAAEPTLDTIIGPMKHSPPEEISPGLREHIALRPRILDALRRMLELGVPIITGTDAGVSWTPFDSLALELELLVTQVDMKPLQAIHSATGGAARALGLAGSVGTVAVGSAADLIVVAGDPATDITALRQVHLVLQAGNVVARDGQVLD
ncbi:MAG TPA: amidohydrolase family protein [Chloroflexota bacterium]|nr:amidohydrolase family protein [Chloroflexota bacterium]